MSLRGLQLDEEHSDDRQLGARIVEKTTIAMTTRKFSAGFRFSASDAVVLLLGFIVAGDLAATMLWPGIAIGFVIAHFFLFCNVVRMERSSELMWAGVFVVLAACTTLAGQPQWPATLAISFAFAVVLIVFEMRKASYHGVFWWQINPRLPEWWEAHALRSSYSDRT